MRVKDAVGRFGEQVAAEHLEQAGLVVIDRNWRCRDGELDLVAREGRVLVFVEVKTRSSFAFGSPAEAVDRRKAERIRRLGVRWIDEHRDGLAPVASIRFDLVAVLRGRGTGVSVEHLRGAF